MHVSSNNVEDIIKYYKGTWVKFKEENDVLFYVENADQTAIYVTSISDEKCFIKLTKEGYFLDFLIPRKTVYQYQNNAVMLSRTPARMWKKGVCQTNTTFRMLKTNGWTPLDFNKHMLEGFVNKPTYGTLNTLKDGETNSVALSPRISMTVGGHVYIDDVMIAKYMANKATLTTKTLFTPHLRPYFPNTIIKELA